MGKFYFKEVNNFFLEQLKKHINNQYSYGNLFIKARNM